MYSISPTAPYGVLRPQGILGGYQRYGATEYGPVIQGGIHSGEGSIDDVPHRYLPSQAGYKEHSCCHDN
jgi:hypothetical protein